MTWLDREQSWLLDGKHVYLACDDVDGLSTFEHFLDGNGVPFVVDQREDVVVFSRDRQREWWASAPRAA